MRFALIAAVLTLTGCGEPSTPQADPCQPVWDYLAGRTSVDPPNYVWCVSENPDLYHAARNRGLGRVPADG